MNIAVIATQIIVILFAITIHEAAHGWAANKLGDPTATILGRVSLNPIVHIDPIGTVLLPAFMIFMGAPPIGWAKPVPVNPLNLKNPKKDNLLISAAGPVSNISVAIVAGILLKIILTINPVIRMTQGGLAYYGMSPVTVIAIMLFTAIQLNVLLAVFNLIPIPPLDGSGILIGFISEEAAQKVEQLRPFGFFIVLAMIWIRIPLPSGEKVSILWMILRPIYSVIRILLF